MFSDSSDYTQHEARMLDLRVKELEELCSHVYFSIIKNEDMRQYLDILDNAASGYPLDYDEDNA